MNTLTIDQNIYNGAEIYAKRHNVSVQQLVEEYLISIQMVDKQIFGEHESERVIGTGTTDSRQITNLRTEVNPKVGRVNNCEPARMPFCIKQVTYR